MLNEYGLPLSDDRATMIHESCNANGGLLTVDPTRLLGVLERYTDLQDKHMLLLDLECGDINTTELANKVDRLRKEVYHPHNIAFVHRWDGISYWYNHIVNDECKGNVRLGMPRVCEYYRKVIASEN